MVEEGAEIHVVSPLIIMVVVTIEKLFKNVHICLKIQIWNVWKTERMEKSEENRREAKK